MKKLSLRATGFFSILLMGLFLIPAFSCSNMINDLRGLQEAKEYYKVWLERIESDSFDLDLETSYEMSATPPEEGFYLVKEEKHRDEEGNIIISQWYNRNRITVKFDPDGGFWPIKGSYISAVREDVHKYGEKIRIPETRRISTDDDSTEWLIYKPGYGFAGWEPSVHPALTCPPIKDGGEITYKAKWIPKANDLYTVEYYAQKVDSDAYELFDTEIRAGKKGEYTEVTIDEIPEGFKPKSPSVDNLLIDSDGRTIVKVYFDRKEYKLTFKLGDKDTQSWKDKTGTDATDDIVLTKRYETPVTKDMIPVPVSTKESARFSGWNTEGGVVAKTVPAKDKTYKAVFADPYKEYKVEHYFQNVSLSAYVHDESLDEIKVGSIGNFSNAIAESRKGFQVKDFDQVILRDGEDTVIKIYYDRIKVKIILNPDVGKWFDASASDTSPSEKKIIEAVYGGKISSYPALARRDGFKFDGWKNDATGKIEELPETGPAENMSFTAKWSRSIANYTVKHYFQNLALDGYELDESMTETPLGRIGQYTEAEAKDEKLIPGFKSNPFDQDRIYEDNSLVIEIYYDRKEIFIGLDADGLYWKGSGLAFKTLKGRYGQTVSYADLQDLERIEGTAEYAIVGWENETTKEIEELPVTYPAENVSYKAQWLLSDVNYKVEHYFQNKTLDGYEIDDSMTETILGKANEYTVAQPKAVTGFTAKDSDKINVKIQTADLVVKIYYDRVPVKLTFDSDGGVLPDSSDKLVVDTYFGLDITEPANPIKTHYNFVQWNPEIPKTAPASDTTYKAVWLQVDYSYSVTHWQQDEYTEDDLQQGKTPDYAVYKKETIWLNHKPVSGEMTEAETLTLPGFTPKPFEQKEVTDDNTTALNIFYDRNRSKITLKAGTDASWIIGPSKITDDVTINTAYGCPVDLTDYASPKRPHYEFAGWNKTEGGITTEVNSLPLKGSASDTVYEALWKQVEFKYTIRYLFENVDETDYVAGEYADDFDYARPDVPVKANPVKAPPAGFKEGVSEENTISVDETSVITVKYDRAEITLTFDATEGFFGNNKEAKTRTVTKKYGKKVEEEDVVAPNTDNILRKFADKWTDKDGNEVSLPETFPSVDTTYKAKWDDEPAADIHGEGIFVNVDPKCDITGGGYVFKDIGGKQCVQITITHSLGNLEVDGLRIGGTVLQIQKKEVAGPEYGTPTGNGTTANITYTYTITAEFNKGPGTYLMELALSGSNNIAYTIRADITKL